MSITNNTAGIPVGALPPDPVALLRERVAEYLQAGGLFNPELMDHEKVRELIVDLRDALLAKAVPREVDDAMVERALKANYRDIDWNYGNIEEELQACRPHVVRGWVRAMLLAALEYKL